MCIHLPMTTDALPHDSIQKLSENLWRVEGALPHLGGRRVMTVARLSDGRLVIHSAITLNEEAMCELESFGKPAVLLIPHKRHRMDAPYFKQRYPELRVFAPRAVVPKAREVVAVDGTYDDFDGDATVRLEMLDGIGDSEGAMIVRSTDGTTVILNEVVFDMGPPRNLAARVLTRLIGLRPGPRVTPVVRLELVTDRRALRKHLERLAAIPDLTRLIVSHEKMSSGARASLALAHAARTLGHRHERKDIEA